MMDAELLVVPDCPNETPAAHLMRRALDDIGLSTTRITTIVVTNPEDAEMLGFIGSPSAIPPPPPTSTSPWTRNDGSARKRSPTTVTSCTAGSSTPTATDNTRSTAHAPNLSPHLAHRVRRRRTGQGEQRAGQHHCQDDQQRH